jgi:hypothetical protein
MLEKWVEEFNAWTQWEDEQVEKHGGEVFISKVMDPIPWYRSNSRRYNIYNNDGLDIIIDCELIQMEDGEYKIVEY